MQNRTKKTVRCLIPGQSLLPFPSAYPVRIICRRLLDTEDELSDIQTDSVPSEVRDWLASTFTRKMGMTKKKPEEKPKFRSIVHAVQAGIFVERQVSHVVHIPSWENLKVSKCVQYEARGVHITLRRTQASTGLTRATALAF